MNASSETPRWAWRGRPLPVYRHYSICIQATWERWVRTTDSIRDLICLQDLQVSQTKFRRISNWNDRIYVGYIVKPPSGTVEFANGAYTHNTKTGVTCGFASWFETAIGCLTLLSESIVSTQCRKICWVLYTDTREISCMGSRSLTTSLDLCGMAGREALRPEAEFF